MVVDMVLAASRLVLLGCLAILSCNEECRLSRSTNCFGVNVYMCYDYVHLDNFSDIIPYRIELL